MYVRLFFGVDPRDAGPFEVILELLFLTGLDQGLAPVTCYELRFEHLTDGLSLQ
jgi:hypothetical protein